MPASADRSNSACRSEARGPSTPWTALPTERPSLPEERGNRAASRAIAGSPNLGTSRAPRAGMVATSLPRPKLLPETSPVVEGAPVGADVVSYYQDATADYRFWSPVNLNMHF